MAQYRSSNPAWRRNGIGVAPGTVPTPGELQAMYDRPPTLSIDDVVVHTAGLLGLAAVAGVGGWLVGLNNGTLALGAMLFALGLSLLISYSRTARPPLVVAFAVLEGFAVGAVSHAYETAYHGIVVQALLGTAGVFAAMLAAYRTGRLRATPRMARLVFGTLSGVVVISLVDLALRSAGVGHVPILNDSSPVGILVTLAILGVAALQFVLDFDYIERAIAQGAPRSEAWRASYGLLVGFVWVYLELLRLLSKLRR